MRVFIAIKLDDEIQEEIYDIINEIKLYSIQGNFTLIENLHLTLAFLGELSPDRIMLIKSTMENIKSKRFKLSMSGLGAFKRSDGDIYWLGVDENSELNRIYKNLHKALTNEGFVLDIREFKPHITLGRKVILKDDFEKDMFMKSTPGLSSIITKISLMKSERISGKLSYTEIYAKILDD